MRFFLVGETRAKKNRCSHRLFSVRFVGNFDLVHSIRGSELITEFAV